MKRVLLLMFLLAGSAGADHHQICANVCVNKEHDHPNGVTVWETTNTCDFDARERWVSEPGGWACMPSERFMWAHVTCMVDGRPIPEIHTPGTNGWIGGDQCPEAFMRKYPSSELKPLPPILRP
jgi:hypothetical protein